MTGPLSLRYLNAKDDALEFVLAQGRNSVLWDECAFIWDSRNLIDDASHSALGSVSNLYLRLMKDGLTDES